VVLARLRFTLRQMQVLILFCGVGMVALLPWRLADPRLWPVLLMVEVAGMPLAFGLLGMLVFRSIPFKTWFAWCCVAWPVTFLFWFLGLLLVNALIDGDPLSSVAAVLICEAIVGALLVSALKRTVMRRCRSCGRRRLVRFGIAPRSAPGTSFHCLACNARFSCTPRGHWQQVPERGGKLADKHEG
jgi:hypothetical protein